MICIGRWCGVVAICLAAVLAGPAAAQETKLEKAREIFRVMQADTMIDQMLDAVFVQMGVSMKRSHPNLPDKALKVIREEVGATLRQAMPELVEQMAVVYGEVFTEQELDGILTFYRSPTGQSLLAKMPQTMGRSVQFSQTWLTKTLGGITQRVERRLRAEGYEL